MEVTCDEPSGHKQMAHSQIVVVIALASIFEFYVAFVLHWFPFGHFSSLARFDCCSPSFASVNCRLRLLVLIGLRICSALHQLVSGCLFEIAFTCFRLFSVY